MKVPGWKEAQDAQRARAKSGWTSIRTTKATLAKLKEIQRKYPSLGLETIINGLIELEREQRELHDGPVSGYRRNVPNSGQLHTPDASDSE